MKKIILCFVVLLLSFKTYSQTTNDIVYLKNGSVIKGIVIEQILGVSLKIRTSDGNIFTYKMEEVEKITKEVNNTNNSGLNQLPTAYTQTQVPVLTKKPFNININAAYSFSWLNGFDDATGFEGAMKSSYQLGMGLSYAINGNIEIESGVSYLLFGGNKYSLTNDYSSTIGTVDISYVQVPILIKYDFMNNLNIKKGTSAGLQTGIQYGFNTSAVDYGDVTIYTPLVVTNHYNNKFTTNTNIDWVIGIFTNMGSSGIAMNFNLGLNDVIKDSPSNKNFKNRNITFSYSLRF